MAESTTTPLNKMAYTAKDLQRFLYLRVIKSWRCEEGGEGEEEKVSLLTHTTARGVGKNHAKVGKHKLDLFSTYSLEVTDEKMAI